MAAVEPTDIHHVVRVTGAVEKPDPQDAPSNLALIGRYVLSQTSTAQRWQRTAQAAVAVAVPAVVVAAAMATVVGSARWAVVRTRQVPG